MYMYVGYIRMYTHNINIVYIYVCVCVCYTLDIVIQYMCVCVYLYMHMYLYTFRLFSDNLRNSDVMMERRPRCLWHCPAVPVWPFRSKVAAGPMKVSS